MLRRWICLLLCCALLPCLAQDDAALKTLTGEDKGDDQAAWDAWWKAQ